MIHFRVCAHGHVIPRDDSLYCNWLYWRLYSCTSNLFLRQRKSRRRLTAKTPLAAVSTTMSSLRHSASSCALYHWSHTPLVRMPAARMGHRIHHRSLLYASGGLSDLLFSWFQDGYTGDSLPASSAMGRILLILESFTVASNGDFLTNLCVETGTHRHHLAGQL